MFLEFSRRPTLGTPEASAADPGPPKPHKVVGPPHRTTVLAAVFTLGVDVFPDVL